MLERRAGAAATSRRFGRLVMPSGPAMADESDRLVPVRGGRINVRTYRPRVGGTLPLYVFLHGGGFCQGTVDERNSRCRSIAAGAGCVVASVDYRLAPENAWPVPPEDAYDALAWLVEQAFELRIDPERVAIGGESAGANLATVAALMSRDRSGPRLCHQWLDVPATDFTLAQPSHTQVPDGHLLDHDAIVDFRDHYLTDPAQAQDPYASPLLADDLSGLPPAWIMTAEYDHLRDEGAAYATRLAAAGVPAVHRRLAGHVHPSFAFTRLVPSAKAYEDEAIAALGEAFRR